MYICHSTLCVRITVAYILLRQANTSRTLNLHDGNGVTIMDMMAQSQVESDRAHLEQNGRETWKKPPNTSFQNLFGLI